MYNKERGGGGRGGGGEKRKSSYNEIKWGDDHMYIPEPQNPGQ